MKINTQQHGFNGPLRHPVLPTIEATRVKIVSTPTPTGNMTENKAMHTHVPNRVEHKTSTYGNSPSTWQLLTA
jgi:hypothetical protein